MTTQLAAIGDPWEPVDVNSVASGATVAIDHVQQLPSEPHTLGGSNVEAPVNGSVADIYSFPIEGWAAGSGCRVAQIELAAEGGIYARVNVDVERPDVAAHLKNDQAGLSGFSSKVSVIGLPTNFELFVHAVFADGLRQTIAVIRGRTFIRRLPELEAPSPLLVITLGRTGSTWLMRLLGLHPEIVAYRPFEYEPRVIS